MIIQGHGNKDILFKETLDNHIELSSTLRPVVQVLPSTVKTHPILAVRPPHGQQRYPIKPREIYTYKHEHPSITLRTTVQIDRLTLANSLGRTRMPGATLCPCPLLLDFPLGHPQSLPFALSKLTGWVNGHWTMPSERV
ncbi:hypothetical protein BC936DRAFT_143357 [Jimgerdemannia flammicorona]|uniref:Uncharacterized protein n=1 Tax=Jimgerdemannia flammicorona TaxID=994334 RepID=A0A433DDY9_9FUNG|nr:hypothetical protein BC936DRAFT_143357 [Jimgerdemannia flammicorona]